ncbi:MAG: polysaccharide biosynthesis/export family protein [Planctomycetaceae bacterium]
MASLGLFCLILSSLPGCTSFLSPINAIPSSRVPAQFLAQPRADYAELELHRLGQEPPESYRLDKDDVLGIYIEGILPPKSEDDVAIAPPVRFPEAGSDLSPAVGFPIPIRDDGTLSLPLIDALDVRGKTLTEVEADIREAYTVTKEILQPGRDQIIVTLMEERTTRVIVIREDRSDELALAGGEQLSGQRELVSGTDRSGSGYVLDLPAYKNDLMHALAETGGLPGLNAKNEVKILRRRLADEQRAGAFVDSFYAQYECDKCMNPPPLPDDPSTIKIPLRFPQGRTPQFDSEDVILEEGDIIYIEARDTEVFYTGGLLAGGQFPLPRDYDIDVLGAMAVAGQGVGGAGRAQGGGAAATVIGGGFSGASPTQLYVFRTLDDGRSVTIGVDLVEAMNNPSERLLVKPGDTLVLRYKPCEEVLNFSLVTFFTFGVRQLFR